MCACVCVLERERARARARESARGRALERNTEGWMEEEDTNVPKLRLDGAMDFSNRLGVIKHNYRYQAAGVKGSGQCRW